MKMIKSIVVVASLLAASLSVSAMEIGRIGNNSGGSIVFTNEKCKNKENMFLSYTYTLSGESQFGCWRYVNSEFFVLWEDGDRRIYSEKYFQPSEAFVKMLEKEANKDKSTY